MAQAARCSNLKPHRVGPHEIEIAAVADIEGHVGLDGASGCSTLRAWRRRSRSRRPTPSGNDAALSPDATRVCQALRAPALGRRLLGNMGRHNAREHNAEVTGGVRVLMRARWCRRLPPRGARKCARRSRSATRSTSGWRASTRCARTRTRAASTCATWAPCARRPTTTCAPLLLDRGAGARGQELDARAAAPRGARSGVPCRERFNALALAFLNLTLRPLSDAAGEPFWDDLRRRPSTSSSCSFCGATKRCRSWRRARRWPTCRTSCCFGAFCSCSAIELDVRATLELEAAIGDATLGASAGFELVQPDLVEQHVRTKHIGLVAYADAMQLFYSGASRRPATRKCACWWWRARSSRRRASRWCRTRWRRFTSRARSS
jgi:hypothetical protein